jgi:lipopolysaccharide/colanic/teichoic acid biosynthesis glycosyltransferase
MIAVLERPAAMPQPRPTMWGLDPVGLHDHFWAARGVCVVRPNDGKPLPEAAELFLLADAGSLAIFRLRFVLETLYWVRPRILFIRVRGQRELGHHEDVKSDEYGRLLSINRNYGRTLPRLAKVALTADRVVARRWQQAEADHGQWKLLRRELGRNHCEVARVSGRVYDRHDEAELAGFVTDLVRFWKDPSRTIPGVKRLAGGVWGPPVAGVGTGVTFIDGAWIGAGRFVDAGETVLGPAALWDEPSSRPQPPVLRWHDIEPTEQPILASVPPAAGPRRGDPSLHRRTKRAFDILFSLLVILLTLPLYPFIFLAIWLEDGRPFFFGHKRETLGGREFACLKFRSMRKDAEQMKQRLLKLNKADGPQFFMENDPRLTRVGRMLRNTNLDELPQFFNVLAGHMSVVGPRPSPYKENQFCPAWREARLSVRPGITGLWQVRRTRQAGSDFQEWIKYDLEYVRRAGWRLDLLIIMQTFRVLLGT